MYASMVEKVRRFQFAYPASKYCIVSTVLLLSSVLYMEFPRLAWAAVYKCRDAAGEPILTNRPARLHDCQMLSEDAPDLKLPVAPMPLNQQADQGASFDSRPAPNPGAPSSPLPPPPCAGGINPLNPLSTPPCVRPDQSGAQPPEATPHRLLLKPVSR